MKNYLELYASKKVKKHQAGAPIEDPNAQGGAQSQGGAQDINGMLMQAYQSQDANLALQVVNLIVEQMQAQGQQGQATPAAKHGMKLNTPVFKKGGELKA